MTSTGAHKLSRQDLTELAAAVLIGAGIDRAEAADAANILIIAEMMGLQTHGVRRVLSYSERARAGGIKAQARIACEAVAPGVRLVDGDNGLGPAIGARALDEAKRAARETGIAVAFCRHSNHFGAVAPYLWLAAREGFASVIMSNASPMMAPTGGREARLGNNPLGFGFPHPGGDPILFDMAISVVSRSRIRDAVAADEPIPEGWGIDAQGQPTTDPAAVMDGLLLPIGGYKGSGLAISIDLLTGLLSGGAFLAQVNPQPAESSDAHDVAQTFILIDTRRLMSEDQLASRVSEFVRTIRATPAADSKAPVRLPGERALSCLRRCEGEGIPLDAELFDALRQMAG